MFYKDIAVITYSEQFNEDLLKVFHSHSILASAIDTTSIDVDLTKQSTFLFKIKLSSKNPAALEKIDGIVKLLENSADIYFQHQKQKCLQHLDFTTTFLKAQDKTSKMDLLKYLPVINRVPHECSVFFSFNPIIISKISFLSNEPDYVEQFDVIESELSKVVNYIHKVEPANLNIVVGNISQNTITKADILRVIYSYLIVFFCSIVLVYFVREKKP